MDTQPKNTRSMLPPYSDNRVRPSPSPLSTLFPGCGGHAIGLRSQMRHCLRGGFFGNVADVDVGGGRRPLRRAAATAVAFDCAFAPPSPGTGRCGKRDNRYLVGCTSRSTVCIWDVDDAARNVAEADAKAEADAFGSTRGDGGGGKGGKGGHKRQRLTLTPTAADASEAGDPLVRLLVVDERGCASSGALYRILFVDGQGQGASPTTTTTTTTIMAVCGDAGVFLYRWADLLSDLEEEDGACPGGGGGGGGGALSDGRDQGPTRRNRRKTRTIRPVPCSVLRPHPSPFGTVEINDADYDRTFKVLYGASGDVFGGPCAWDVETGTLLGNFGSTALASNRVGQNKKHGKGRYTFRGGGQKHNDYLHCVKVVHPSVGGIGSHTVLTGGEDGKMGIWDSKERHIVELVDVRSAIQSCPPGSLSYDGQRRRHDDGEGEEGGGGTRKSHVASEPLFTNGNDANAGLWVSSLDVSDTGSWAAMCGGIKTRVSFPNTKRSRFRTSGAGTAVATAAAAAAAPILDASAVVANEWSSARGYVSLFSLPTRSVTSAYLTREAINDVSYYSGLDGGNGGSGDSLLTVGNEPVLSRWNEADLSMGRTGRTWMGCAAGFGISSISFHNGAGGLGSGSGSMVAVAGACGSLDVFSDLGHRSFGLTFR